MLAIIAVSTGLVLWRKRKHQGKGTVLNNGSNNLFGQWDHDIYLFVLPQIFWVRRGVFRVHIGNYSCGSSNNN